MRTEQEDSAGPYLERKAEKLRGRWSEVPSWVFCTQLGTPYDVAFVQRAFKRTIKAAQLPLHFSPHSLRHTYASLMLQAGESPVYVSGSSATRASR